MRSRSAIGPVIAMVGAVLVWVGALSEWARTSVDPTALADAMARDPENVPGVAAAIDASHTWVEGADPAAWMLVFTTAGLVFAALLLVRARRVLAAVTAAIGLAVAAVASATRVDGPSLAAAIASDTEDTVVGTWAFGDGLAEAVVVHGGSSTTRCIVGGVLMAVGGALAWAMPRRDTGDPDYVPWAREEPGA
jgi:hypothetical protein